MIEQIGYRPDEPRERFTVAIHVPRRHYNAARALLAARSSSLGTVLSEHIEELGREAIQRGFDPKAATGSK